MSTNTAVPTFSTKATSSNGDFELPPPGTHPAILVGLIDLGTHLTNFKDKEGNLLSRHKILCLWELTAETDSKGQNFIVAQNYTWSLNAKAKLRTIVEGFRAKALVDGEEYPLGDMLGKPCMISLSEGISGNGKRFMEVSSVSPPMRSLTVPPATCPLYGFLLSAIHSALDPIDIPAWVPKLYGRSVVDEIKASKEFGDLPNF